MDPGAAGRAFVDVGLLVGATFAVAPAFAARRWLGVAPGAPAASVPLRAMGARDVALGVGALGALRRRADARPWLRAAALAEAANAAAILAVARHLPPGQRVVASVGPALQAAAAAVLSRRAPGRTAVEAALPSVPSVRRTPTGERGGHQAGRSRPGTAI